MNTEVALSLAENEEHCMLDEHDCLAVDDAAVADHGQRLINSNFESVDVLAIGGDATARIDSMGEFIGSNVEEQFLCY
jgi:hypothetical protein